MASKPRIPTETSERSEIAQLGLTAARRLVEQPVNSNSAPGITRSASTFLGSSPRPFWPLAENQSSFVSWYQASRVPLECYFPASPVPFQS